MSNNRTSKSFSLISCLSQIHHEPSARSSLSPIPVIALVNGLSGGHKGEKVQRLLNRRKIPAFDLLLLSTDETYFKSFIQQFSQIYDNIIMEELHRIKKKTDKNFSLHPRILIGGGDGSIAWALSILDRALLDEELLRNFWRRSRIISHLPETDENGKKLSLKRRLSANSVISEEFYYSKHRSTDDDGEDIGSIIPLTPLQNNDNNMNYPQITPFETGGVSFDFNINVNDSNSSTNDEVTMNACNDNKINKIPPIETCIVVIDNENDGKLPKIEIDLQVIEEEEDKLDKEANYFAATQYSSSPSLSAEEEEQIMEDFMNQSLSNITSPNKHERLLNKKREKIKNKRDESEEEKYENDDSSLSESLVTREELQSVIRQKESAAYLNNSHNMEELRILQSIYDSRIGPSIALIPLGTGNDLSRCLGTGFTYPGSRELVTKLVSEYKKAPMTKLDRWKIEFCEMDNTYKNRQTSEMLCYFSVGFEGQIAYRFAQARSKNPKLFDRPWKNKIQYILSGIGAGVEEVCGITKPLNDYVDVYVDGEKLKLPSNTRSLVISSIQSMADGVYFWGKGDDTKKDIKQYDEPSLGDGKLEIMAAKGIYKYLQMRMGMSHYRRLSQPKKVTIITKTDLPIQVDGESWIESKGVIQIYLLHQVFAVVGKNEPRGVQII